MFNLKINTIIAQMARYKWRYFIGISALVLVDIAQLAIPQITGKITDDLQSGTMTDALLLQAVMRILLVGVVIALGRFLWRYFIFGTSRMVERHLRKDFFVKLESLSVGFYNGQKTGDLMAYATNDLNAIRMMVGPGILMALDATVLCVFVLIRMVTSISVKLTLVSIIPLPFIAIGSLLLGRVIRRRFKEKQEAFAYMSDIVQENISGMRVIKAFVKESYEMTKFSVANQRNFDKNMKVVKLFAIMMPLVMLISGLSIAIVLGYGGRMTMTGDISLGEFVAFVQYIMMLIWPMMAFGWCINIMSQGMASLTRYDEIMQTPIEVKDTSYANPEAKVQGAIEIKNLTFSYSEEDEPVLKKLTMAIEKGQMVGILGRTGSGKTTIANLLLRLFNPREGTVFLDGVDILTFPLKTLRQSIGYVPQDNFLFSDTIKNNIGFIEEAPEEEKVIAYAKMANVHDNIVEFKEGYDTLVGERGVTLSGGQKQRISIARALMSEAPILILDDAVSAVDTKTEEAILSMLRNERKDKTTIMIAHRISTLQNADIIFVVDDGKVIEYGSHDTLMAHEGFYYEITMKQQLEKAINEDGEVAQ